jgi:hypothetical protein
MIDLETFRILAPCTFDFTFHRCGLCGTCAALHELYYCLFGPDLQVAPWEIPHLKWSVALQKLAGSSRNKTESFASLRPWNHSQDVDVLFPVVVLLYTTTLMHY